MKNKNNDKSVKYLSVFIVVIAFALAFGLLINHQQNNNLNLADASNNNFTVMPEEGKVIVAKDLEAIYPKYYVIYFDDDMYSVYVYNYYETVSQYNLEFNRLIDKIVDYNKNKKMIRYLLGRSYGTYDEVIGNLSIILECDNLKVY